MNLDQLLSDIRNSTGPNRWVDAQIHGLLVPNLMMPWYVQSPIGVWRPRDFPWVCTSAHNYSGNIYYCQKAISNLLPGFWYSSGLCALSGHASIGPDYNGHPLAEWPEDPCDAGWHEDLGGDGDHRQCLALLSCLVQALIYKRDHL